MKRRASIPGRINIIGEHTDYAGGCSLAFASQHRLVLEAEFVEDGYHGEPTVIALWKEAGGPPCTVGGNKFNSDWKRDVIIGGTLLEHRPRSRKRQTSSL